MNINSLPLDPLLERIRTENLNVYRASPQRLREDVGQESQIAQDYRGRLIYELLQNADDAMSSAASETASISFILDDDALWVANSGRPLDEADVRGLCGISASSKAAKTGKRRASIGHKGMGFKSVLEIADAPEVYSTTTCFRFGPEAALRAVAPLVEKGALGEVTRAPVTRFPWPIAEEPARWRELRDRGMQTAFRFPLRAKMTREQRDWLAQALAELPVTSLVFLKHLGRVEVTIRRKSGSRLFAWTVRRQRVTEAGASDVRAFSDAGTYRVVLTPDVGTAEMFLLAHDADIAMGDHRGGLDDFSWEGVEFTEVSVAARLREGRPVGLEPSWRKIHVFLPSGEPCPYDLLVSGAFSASLSRQEIRVEAEASNYNRFLLRHVARLLGNVLLPCLLTSGADVVHVLKLLDRRMMVGAPCPTPAAQTLHEEVRAALRDRRLLPTERGDLITMAGCVVPPLVDDASVGFDLRALLPMDASLDEARFPSANLCCADVARVLVDHSARALTPAEAAVALAWAEPARSTLEMPGKIFVDPILRVLQKLWLALDTDERESLANAVRRQRLFPVEVAEGNTALRVATVDVTCFFPPRSLHGTVPLEGLCFLMQEICWGDLTPKERNQLLKDDVAAWRDLFNVQDFKFPDVMRASVLPALELDGDAEAHRRRESLRSLESVAAICQLAGRTPKSGTPLPYERLGANRALFNLSRLDVPCRGDQPGEIVWVPAYRVYFGTDWVGDASVENILTLGRQLGMQSLPKISFLAEPEKLRGLLDRYGHLRAAADLAEEEPGADEVSLDEDDEATLEEDDRGRWFTFFRWLGVNQALRPVHFHDVEDRASGWLRTADLRRPEGRIFQSVSAKDWDAYAARLRRSLAEQEVDESATLYFYRLHDLEHLGAFLGLASRDRTAKLGRALYEHLARNWGTLERFGHAQIAAVPAGLMPTMRAPPKRAKDEELVDVGPDFWVARLQGSPFCPTGHGPRRGDQTWLPTLEVERRFGRRARAGIALVPALEVDPALLKGKAKGLAHTLGMREELSAATFTSSDARALLDWLRHLYAARCEAGEDLRVELRDVIRPAYRHLFELLSSRDRPAEEADDDMALLAAAPLLANDSQKRLRFFEDRSFFYVERRDTRERLSSDVTLWSFVLEALPGARTPLVQLFNVRVLEETLRWAPQPGDAVLDGEGLARLREALQRLAPYLLARLAADRTDERLARLDARRLRRFVERLEPVTHLDLGCALDELTLGVGSVSRDAFVAFEADEPSQVFVVWGDHPWPPDSRQAEALANALCDVFGAGYFEPFLALIQARTPEAWERLLRRAGAPVEIDEKRNLFLDGDVEASADEILLGPVDDQKTTIAMGTTELDRVPAVEGAEPREPPDRGRVALFSPGQLLVEGEPVLVVGMGLSEAGAAGAVRKEAACAERGRHTASGGDRGYGGRTDLGALDAVGMWVTLSFERNRLRRAGLASAEIFDPSIDTAQPKALVFDVSSPEKIACARALSTSFATAMERLRQGFQVSVEWPGFDVLTLDPRLSEGLDRLIELKSSGVTSQFQEMSWNEWKTARSSALRAHFYLYLVGNLRSDLEGAQPFVRTIHNPFEQLAADVRVSHATRRKVQLAVHLFEKAEHLTLSVRPDPRASSSAQHADSSERSIH